jgi:hypothetical protein
MKRAGIIAEARNLVETGQAASEWAAFMKVAATIPGPSQRSIAERLRRKAGRENRPLNSISGRRAAAKLARDSEKG